METETSTVAVLTVKPALTRYHLIGAATGIVVAATVLGVVRWKKLRNARAIAEAEEN